MDKQELMKLARRWYSMKKCSHALRVANYAAQDCTFGNEEIKNSLWKIGLFHDILEDTECPEEEIRPYVTDQELEAIKLLTHHKEDYSYDEYVQIISHSDNPYVKLVKRADMKDHLMLTTTLTKKLREKYYPNIKYLI